MDNVVTRLRNRNDTAAGLVVDRAMKDDGASGAARGPWTVECGSRPEALVSSDMPDEI